MRNIKSIIISLFLWLFFSLATFAFEVIEVPDSVNAINITAAIDIVEGNKGRVQLNTAAGEDGIVRRIEVLALDENTNPKWALFALKNNSDVQIERLLVAPFFNLANSSLFNPDLGAKRINFLTASHGLRPKRITDYEADVFLVTIDPGATVTYIAELSGDKLPNLYLWKEDAYRDYVNSFTLFRGTVLGIAGLAAVFLSIMFVVKGRGVFPAMAAFAWVVLIYLLIDFGVMGRLLGISNGSMQTFRAGAEAGLATTLFGFLFIYLNLHRWHLRFVHIGIILLTIFISLFIIAYFEPSLSATISRISLFIVGIIGLILIIILAIRGYDRAVLLFPTWLVYLAWLFYSWLVISGQISSDIAQPSVAGGLILIVMLMGFTAIQHAFAHGQVSIGSISEIERRALAITGSGDFVFDWNIERDKVAISDELLTRLALNKNELRGAIKRWLTRVHKDDKDRFKTALDTLIELKRGKINTPIRLLHNDNSYRTFQLRAKPVLGSNGQVTRIVGTLQDISHERAQRERLLHDSVYDSLTGLPNKKLFIDRLEQAIIRSREGKGGKPAVFLIDIDDFSNIDGRIGLSASDSVLLATSRRIARLLSPLDSVARINGDQFAVLLCDKENASDIAKIAEQIRKSMQLKFNFGQKDISLSVSIGITIFDNSDNNAEQILRDAELAMYYAKQKGGNRIEAFRAVARSIKTQSDNIEQDMLDGLLKGEFYIDYQPIVDIQEDKMVGAEALLRWKHPKRGIIGPNEFIQIAERTGQIEKLGKLAFELAGVQTLEWSKLFTLSDDFFISINLSPRQLANENMLTNMKTIIAQYSSVVKHLQLEITESQIMANAEHSSYMLTQLKSMGLKLALDDFGTGFSSLSYLHRFPFDFIKIPAPFVQISEDKRLNHTQIPILRAIISLARELDMQVISEGVENESELERLISLGCKYAQGFLFGAPMSAKEFGKKLNSQFGTR